MTCQTSSKAPAQSKSRSLPQFPCVLGIFCSFSKYAQSMCSENYSANIDILGRLHNILRFFDYHLTKFILIQNGIKCKVCFPFCDFKCGTGRRSNCFHYLTRGYGFDHLVGIKAALSAPLTHYFAVLRKSKLSCGSIGACKFRA